MNTQLKPPAYFCTLDIIRGFAAIVVVLCHWQFFYYANYTWVPDGVNKATLPFYTYLSPIYNDGEIVVDLFFLLSGFVFFWLYADRIAARKVDFRKFMVFRMSRLYPMHLATLVSVTVLQWFMIRTTGRYFIIQINDVYHFILNLFFMQNWGIEKGMSFNAPVWSVSVEVFLYLVFFSICYLKLQHKKWLLFLLIPAGVIIQYSFSLIGKGMYTFFLGGLIYYLYIWILKKNKTQKYLPALATLSVMLWAFVFTEYHFSYTRNLFIKEYLHVLPHKSPQSAEATFILGKNFFFRTFVSPATVLALALWETKRGTINKKWAVLGNCSYAMYLIHFSLMLLFALIVEVLHIDHGVFRSPVTLSIFFVILISLSIAAYYYFELPAQDKLRKKFSKVNHQDKVKIDNADVKAVEAKIPIK